MGHVPVMVREVLEALHPAEGAVVVDGTAGAGGHSLELARGIGRTGRLFALDRDPAMAAIAAENLGRAFDSTKGPDIRVVTASYDKIGEVLSAAGLPGADAILLDLGMNSIQVDDPSRGFGFRNDGPLDGRFNPGEPGCVSIAELVATATEQELADWIFRLSDERHARRIAAAIVRARASEPIRTTGRLAEIIRSAVPANERHLRLDAATRTMQALRIVANAELETLERGLRASLAALNPGGRLAVLSYHSGEDRLTKRVFDEAGSPRPDPTNLFRATTTEGLDFHMPRRGAVKPTGAEVAANPRSRSARLRAIERRGGAA